MHVTYHFIASARERERERERGREREREGGRGCLHLEAAVVWGRVDYIFRVL
jgi:hypothetical protein